jgi:hypothetical protein
MSFNAFSISFAVRPKSEMFYSFNPFLQNYIPAKPNQTKMFLIVGGRSRLTKVDLVPENPSTPKMFHELSPFPRDVLAGACGMLKPGNVIRFVRIKIVYIVKV